MENEVVKSKKWWRNKWVLILTGILASAVLVTVISIIIAYSMSWADQKKNPNYVEIGMQYLSEMKYDEAIAAFESALEIDPRNVEAYVGLAEVYTAQENYPAIVQLLENAQEIFGEEFPPQLQEYLDLAYSKSIEGIDVLDLTSSLTLFGDAFMREDGCIQLTEPVVWQGGSVWLENTFKSAKGFVISFEYYAGEGRDDVFGGADGIALCLSSEKGLGQEGADLGFVPGSYGMELDSYPNGGADPDGKHIALINGDVFNHVTYSLDDRVDDSEWHKVVFFYHNGTAEVYLDGEFIISDDFVSLPENIYIGISASTGSGYNRHVIRKFGITEEALN